MYTKKTEQISSHAVLIVAAEQFIIFNDKNSDSDLSPIAIPLLK